MGSSKHFEEELNEQFEQFAESLQGNETSHLLELGLLEKVRKHLQERLGQLKDPHLKEAFAQAVFFYGGNFKSTKYGVFDIIIKLPVSEALEVGEPLQMFQATLLANAKYLEIIPTSISPTYEDDSIQFSFGNGTNVRVLVVAEGVVPTAEGIYRKMRGSPKNWRYYTASSVEMRREFMATQEEIVHSIAALLKRWLLSVELGEVHQYLGDVSIILELVSTYSVLDLRGREKEVSVLRGFTKAIEFFCFVDKIRIAFDIAEEGSSQWKILPYVGLRHRPPFVENPMNAENMLEGVHDTVRDILQQVGFATKARLLKMLETRAFCERGAGDTWSVKWDKLLEPMRVPLELPENWEKTQAACFVYLGVPKRGGPPGSFPSKEHLLLTEMVKERLADVTKCLVSMNQNLYAARALNHCQSRTRLNKRVTETVKYAMKVAIPGILVNGTNRSQLRIEWFDTAISVPYRVIDGISVLVGFKWDSKSLPRFEDFCFY